MPSRVMRDKVGYVSLFTREWIEITNLALVTSKSCVSLFTREWIEIASPST